MRLKALVTTFTSMVLTVPALADGEWHSVPEIGANGSLAAIMAVAAIALIVWERRRTSSK